MSGLQQPALGFVANAIGPSHGRAEPASTRCLKRRQREGSAVRVWNEQFPVGTKVAVSKDDHSIVFGETTHEAYMMGGHSAVIHVSGVRGAYSLFRVTPMPEVKP